MRFCALRIMNLNLSQRHSLFRIPMSPQPMISAMRHSEMEVQHWNPACRGSFRACFHPETVRSDENRLIFTGNRLTCTGNWLVGIANGEVSTANRRFSTGNKAARTAAGR